MLSSVKSDLSLPSSVTVLGATGTVGRQALEVARHHHIRVDCLTANTDAPALEALAREFSPAVCVMADEGAARELSVRLADTDIRVAGGADAICDAIRELRSPVVVNAILGEAGLMPTLAAISTGSRLALSNKESLVVAGEIVMASARDAGCEIVPVDSEHSAIYQCLRAGDRSEIRRILLTASGGPFRHHSAEQLAAVTLAETLAHPTWRMGAKITVDSATLMNKGFEIIEAVHLFGVSPDQIEVIVHPESIIHSAVEYIDSAVIAQLSAPDMRLCVAYAMSCPCRVPGLTPPLDLFSLGRLTFEPPSPERFPLLALAESAIRQGGAIPAVVNAADEVAVSAFLGERISFARIAEIVGETAARLSHHAATNTLDGILAADHEARQIAAALL
jgi:1-deoxy-D-xylulose-5-phosphate reductoisomerase